LASKKPSSEFRLKGDKGMSEMALDFIRRAIKGLKYEGEFESYKSLEDAKESWIDDLETIKEILQSSTPTVRPKE